MRYHFPVLFILLFISLSSVAQDAVPDFSYVLIAKNHQLVRVYKPGMHLCIHYKSDTYSRKARGYFMGLTNGKVVIAARKKGGVQRLIAAEDITLLRKISPGKRIILAAIGTGMVAGGAALVDQGDASHPGAGMANALLIPVIGAGVYCILATPATLLLEKLSERKRSHGWSFVTQRY